MALIRTSRLVRSLRRFHDDEGGMEALQTVVILAVAALVILMLSQWIGHSDDTGSNTIGGWVNDQLHNIFDLNFE